MSDWDASVWMERLPGVGRKTAYCVLLFSRLRRAVLPVDTGCRRFAVRFGVLSRSATWDDAHFLLRKQLPADWGALQLELFHGTTKWLVQNYCKHEPACALCPLLQHCPYGQRRMDDEDLPEIYRRRVRTSSQESPWQLCLPLA
jgi:endonuclease-3